MHDDCQFDSLARQLKRPIPALGELDAIASRPQHVGNSRAQLNLSRYNKSALSHAIFYMLDRARPKPQPIETVTSVV
jgi:hypothetical protein